jgi:hypothetical protein
MNPRKQGEKEVGSMALVRHGKAFAWMDLGPCVTMGLSEVRLGRMSLRRIRFRE